MKASIDAKNAKGIIKKYYLDEEGKDVDVYIYPIEGDRYSSDSALIEVKDYINIAGYSVERSDYIGDDELIKIMNHYFEDYNVESLIRNCEYEKDEYLMYSNATNKFVSLDLILSPKKLNQDIDKKPKVKIK